MLEQNVPIESLRAADEFASAPDHFVASAGGKAEPAGWLVAVEKRKVWLGAGKGQIRNAKVGSKCFRQPLVPEVVDRSMRESSIHAEHQRVGQFTSMEDSASASGAPHNVNAVSVGMLMGYVRFGLCVAQRDTPRLPAVEAHKHRLVGWVAHEHFSQGLVAAHAQSARACAIAGDAAVPQARKKRIAKMLTAAHGCKIRRHATRMLCGEDVQTPLHPAGDACPAR